MVFRQQKKIIFVVGLENTNIIQVSPLHYGREREKERDRKRVSAIKIFDNQTISHKLILS